MSFQGVDHAFEGGICDFRDEVQLKSNRSNRSNRSIRSNRSNCSNRVFGEFIYRRFCQSTMCRLAQDA